ncbi:MAG TPA: Gfo/Idh/MocA family oxidoreductase, partial [Lacipirellulaceae bacterium]|nr:Gfo/Idh/MocA family oxidoreductase [Lacipirellulaceae bacterium]
LFLAKFSSGALGSFEATRMAPGRKNYNRFEVNGSKGSLVFNFEEMNVLQFYNCADPPGRQGFRSIMATEGVHPYVSAWWPPGHVLGYEHTFVHAVYELMRAIGGEKTIMADFHDGAQCVAVLDAVEKSIDEGKWAKVEMVK